MVDQAEIHRMAKSKEVWERKKAAEELKNNFAIFIDKKQAWEDLHQLTSDTHSDVRIAANHSAGRVSIFRASVAKNEYVFRKEIENALEYFEKASKEATYDDSKEGTYFNPAEFCLPFYRSFYTLTFKKEDAEVEFNKYLSEAKSAVQGSKSKEKLLEAVENLGNALKEAHKVQDFSDVKGNLNAYRRYCERASELLDTTEEKMPGASRLIRKGLPIIDERIKGIIAQINEKAKALCRNTQDTPFENLGKDINRAGQCLAHIRNPISLEKQVQNMQTALSAICARMPVEERGDACELLKKANDEQYIENKLELIGKFLSIIPTTISKSNIAVSTTTSKLYIAYEFHEKAEQYKNEAKSEIGEKKVTLIRAASENYGKASDQYEKCGILVDSYLTKALSKSILVSIETDDIQALKDLEEAIIEIDKAIKITDDINVKQLRRQQGLRFEYLARKNIWFAIISKDNTINQDNIQALKDLEEAIIEIDKEIKITDDINVKQLRRLQGLRSEYLARKNIWFAIISKDNTINQDNILFDIVDCFKNASKMFEQDGNKDYVCKCKGCACLYESLSYLSKAIKSRKLKDFWTSYKSFEKSKEYYSSAKSVLGVIIIDKIGELMELLKKLIDDNSDCIENGKTPKIGDWTKIFHKIYDILEEITIPGLKKICIKYLWDEVIENYDSIQERLSKTEELNNDQNKGNIEITNSNGIQITIGNDNYQVKSSNSPN